MHCEYNERRFWDFRNDYEKTKKLSRICDECEVNFAQRCSFIGTFCIFCRFCMPCVAVCGRVKLWSNAEYWGSCDVHSRESQRASSQRLCYSLHATHRERSHRKASNGGRQRAEDDAWTMWEASSPAAETKSNGRQHWWWSRKKALCECDLEMTFSRQ